MRTQLELFFIAIGFFTRLPVPGWVGFAPEKLGHAARYLPLVGWLVGLVGVAVYLLAVQVLPVDIAVVLAMAARALGILAAALLERDDLGAAGLLDDLGGDGGTGHDGRADGHAGVGTDGQHFVESDGGAVFDFELLDFERFVDGDFVLLAAGLDHCEHGRASPS